MSTTVPVEAGLFEEHADGDAHLLGAHCRACDRYTFPRASTCPYCASTDVKPVELSNTGTLWAWTAVTAPPPGYTGRVPFGFGVVELPEGLRVITRIEEHDPARLEFRMPMKMVIVPVGENDAGDTLTTWSFDPVSGQKAQ